MVPTGISPSMGSKMTVLQNADAIHFCNIVLIIQAVCSADVPQKDAKFSLSSLMEAALPAIHPIIAAGSDRCETFKSYFGLTYEQMTLKNVTPYDSLEIDHITRRGNIKYNITESRRMGRYIKNTEGIVILIHGFLESSDGVMVKGIAPALMKKPGIAVLALDGRKLISLEYFRSSTYARFMGEHLGAFLTDIINGGQNPSNISLVGHSLGAHIAGIAGKKVQELTGKQIGRITGLDPAGPCFSNVSSAGKLDPGDAEYVDVIHTSGGILGQLEPVGQKDFFPAGGLTQPGCFLSTCDHSRAWQLFAESIMAPNLFPARKCPNWALFRGGYCSNNEIAYMGYNSKEGSSGTYYLNTGPTPPYGLGPAGSG